MRVNGRERAKELEVTRSLVWQWTYTLGETKYIYISMDKLTPLKIDMNKPENIHNWKEPPFPKHHFQCPFVEFQGVYFLSKPHFCIHWHPLVLFLGCFILFRSSYWLLPCPETPGDAILPEALATWRGRCWQMLAPASCWQDRRRDPRDTDWILTPDVAPKNVFVFLDFFMFTPIVGAMYIIQFD